ncbi:RDD family protein [Rhabdothermincola sediminis]|uniref:RDD family protein n=1 Tax=Rhabdothermincola sediminis TaxID=2751370 RepID=UPI001AA08E91|nr:RDD family protein [Rhabdothermincola sediminis]
MDPTNVVGRRVVAWLADGLIDLVLALGFASLFGIDLHRTSTTGTVFDVDPTGDRAWAAVALVVLAWALFKSILVASYGWTPGKLLCGVRVATWNGRPPGLWRAIVRGGTMSVLGAFLGCFYWLVGVACMALSRDHRQPADWLAGTFVIDADYQGRLILDGPRHPVAGPPSITRQEAAALLSSEPGPAGAEAIVPPGPKSAEPFYDRRRDTYVVWSEKRQTWLQFDKKTDDWVELT